MRGAGEVGALGMGQRRAEEQRQLVDDGCSGGAAHHVLGCKAQHKMGGQALLSQSALSYSLNLNCISTNAETEQYVPAHVGNSSLKQSFNYVKAHKDYAPSLPCKPLLRHEARTPSIL